MSRRREYLYTLGSGIIIGFGLILPGVSGAVLAMALGLYQPLIEAAAEPFSNWSSKLRLLIPLALGLAICLLLFSRLLEFSFIYYPLPTLYLFLGLVAGGLPTVAGWANRSGFRLSFAVSFGLGFAFVLFLTALPNLVSGLPLDRVSPLALVFQGMLAGAGLVVPGLSASFLLMAFGVYQGLLSAVARLNFAVLLPVCIGVLPAVVVISRVMDRLLKKMEGYAFYGILGLITGSMYLVFPGLPRTLLETVICFALLLSGLWVSLRFAKNYI